MFPSLVNDDGYKRVYVNEHVGIRLLRRMSWLGALRWWHLVALLAVLGAGAIGWRLMFPPAPVTGAVLATVNGTPVTDYDVLAEAQAAGVPQDALDPATRKSLLSQVIDRRLLVAAAHETGVEKDPVFRASQQRAGEMVAAGIMATRLVGQPAPASTEVARRYLAAHPMTFAHRQTLVLKGVVADLRGLPANVLDRADTLDDVIATLKQSSTAFEPVERRLDTAALPPDMATRMAAAKPGALFQFPAGGRSLIGTVIARQPALLPPADQLEAARTAAGREQQDAQFRASLATLRRKATIRMTADAPAP